MMQALVPAAECQYGRDHVAGDNTHGGGVFARLDQLEVQNQLLREIRETASDERNSDEFVGKATRRMLGLEL